jgi:PKHD-type hydroxylase
MDSFPPQNGIQRKLSCVILLNDPSEFEGGILQFKGMEDQNVLDKQGSIIVFPTSPPYHHTAHLVKSGEKIMVPQHWIH